MNVMMMIMRRIQINMIRMMEVASDECDYEIEEDDYECDDEENNER